MYHVVLSRKSLYTDQYRSTQLGDNKEKCTEHVSHSESRDKGIRRVRHTVSSPQVSSPQLW